MEKETISSVTETLSKSYESAQSSATDVKGSVQQILMLSGEELHGQTVAAILEDKETDLIEKLAMIDRMNQAFDSRQERNTDRVIRLQDAQTRNSSSASNAWGDCWGWIALASVAVLILITPQGRTALTSMTRRLAA